VRRPEFLKISLLLVCLAFAWAPLARAQSAPPADPRFEIRRYVIEGATLVSAAELDAATQPFAGKNKNFADVQRALEAIEKAFTARGFSAVQVILPEQELEKGEVRFKVVEAKIGKVIVEGNKNFDEENIRRSLPSLKEGQAPNTQLVADNLRIANESASKQTTVLLRGGTEEAQVDAVVRVADEKPLKYSLSFDNSGTANTGMYRTGIGFQHSNMWNLDHSMSWQYVTALNDDVHPNRVVAYPNKQVFILGGSYHIPLYSLGDSIDLSAGYSNVNSGVVQNLFNIAGSGTVAGFRYNYNLPRWGDIEHKLAFGWDWRAYESRVTQLGSQVQLVPDITVRPISVTYNATHRAATSETNAYFGVYQNIPGPRDASLGAFNATRVGADAWYFLQRYGISHNRSFANDVQLRASFSGQLTRDQLVSGEQFGIGGADSVRGFTEREISNDYGFRGSLEVYTPDFAGAFKSATSNSRVRALAFYDWARAQRNRPTILEVHRQSIASAGFGLRFALGSNFFIRADYGVVMDAGGLQAKSEGRGHVNMSFIF
jgi:hemolysin activation/secretion protein